MLQACVSSVSVVSYVSFKCFYMNVAKVDLNVAHVVMAIHICFKCMYYLCSVKEETMVCVPVQLFHA
jgi:hypothetical protein